VRVSNLAAVLDAVASERDHLDDLRAREQRSAESFAAAIIAAALAGASQRSIAERAKVSQPYVSKLLATRDARFQPRSRLGRILATHRDDVLAAAERRGASDVRVFGSVARGDDGPGSDVDLLVDIAAGTGLFAIAVLESEMADLLGVPVDLHVGRLLKPAVLTRAARDVVPL